MAEYMRGMKAGFMAGLRIGILFAIIFAAGIYYVSAPILEDSQKTSDVGGLKTFDDGTSTKQFVMLSMFNAAVFAFGLGILSGIALGIMLSPVIPKINAKAQYITTGASILFFVLLYGLKAASILTKIPATYLQAGAYAFLVFPVSFAIIEGFLLGHFWNKFGQTPHTTSNQSDNGTIRGYNGTN